MITSAGVSKPEYASGHTWRVRTARPGPLTWRGVTARRMDRSSLIEPAANADPADIARALVGAHAQILQAGEVSIARRAGLTRADVELRCGSIGRS